MVTAAHSPEYGHLGRKRLVDWSRESKTPSPGPCLIAVRGGDSTASVVAPEHDLVCYWVAAPLVTAHAYQYMSISLSRSRGGASFSLAFSLPLPLSASLPLPLPASFPLPLPLAVAVVPAWQRRYGADDAEGVGRLGGHGRRHWVGWRRDSLKTLWIGGGGGGRYGLRLGLGLG